MGAISTYASIQVARFKKHEADGKGEEARGQRIENDRREAVVRTEIAIHEALQEQLSESKHESERLKVLLDKQLLRNVEALAAQGVREVTVESVLD